MDLFSQGLQAIEEKLLRWWELFAAQIPNLIIAILIVTAFWFIARVISGWVRQLLGRTHAAQSVRSLIESTAWIFVFTLGVFFALGIVGLDKTVLSLLAGVGVIGIALGFAFQDMAANLISGLFIAIQKPFDVNDLIEIGDVMGNVEHIGLRDTRVRNFSGQIVHIPNKKFMESNLMNYNTTGERRIEVTVGVEYRADLTKTMSLLKEALLQNVTGYKKDKGVTMMLKDFGDSAIGIVVWIWIDNPGGDFLGVNNQTVTVIKNTLDKAGVNIPFPIRTLEMGPDMRESIRLFYDKSKKLTKTHEEFSEA